MAYAFDPERKAILLVAGDKSGIASKRFLQELDCQSRSAFCGTFDMFERQEDQTMKKPVAAKKVIAGFSAERRKRIKTRAKELIATEMALGDIRKSRALTQEQVAKKLGGKQVYVSRLESRSDVKVSTLRGYVKALGGELQLLVTFPEGGKVEIARRGKG